MKLAQDLSVILTVILVLNIICLGVLWLRVIFLKDLAIKNSNTLKLLNATIISTILVILLSYIKLNNLDRKINVILTFLASQNNNNNTRSVIIPIPSYNSEFNKGQTHHLDYEYPLLKNHLQQSLKL